jgi:hypothetical protein
MKVSFTDYEPPSPPEGSFELEVKDCKMNDAGDSVALQLEVVDGKNPDGSDPRGEQFTEFILVDENRMKDHKDGGKFAKRRVYEMCKALDSSLAEFDTDELQRYIGRRFKAIVKAKPDSNGTLRPRISVYGSALS